MQAQMARMMQAQQGALISQQAAALEQAQAQMFAMQRQMAEMQRQLEETRAREAAPRRGRRGRGSAASDRDWRADAPGPMGAEAPEANPRDKNRGGGWAARARRGQAEPFRRASARCAAAAGFRAQARDPNAYGRRRSEGRREEQGQEMGSGLITIG